MAFGVRADARWPMDAAAGCVPSAHVLDGIALQASTPQLRSPRGRPSWRGVGGEG